MLQFLKIKILDSMSTDIGYFLQNQGAENFLDTLDLTCGAVPEGKFEEVIDPAATEQFLSLYEGIAKYRFAFAVTQALKINQAFYPAIRTYCFQKGNSLKPEEPIQTVQAAYDVINSCILDGSTGVETKKITKNEEKLLVWDKIKETHENYWNKAGGSVDIYYDLQNCFIQGILEGSSISFSNKENQEFSLSSH